MLHPKVIKRKIGRAAPSILSILASAGVVGSVVLAIKATSKAEKMLEESKRCFPRKTKTEIFTDVLPLYLPTIICGASTISCIIGANRLGHQQRLSLVGAYAMLDQSYKDYQKKVKKMLGEDGEKEIRDELIKDDLAEYEPGESDLPLFYDIYSKRYFNRSMEEVIEAEYHVNRNFILKWAVDLNEFYRFLGLEPTDFGKTVGWSCTKGYEEYGYQWIDFQHELVKTDDGLECYVISCPFEPHPDFLDD